MNLAIVSLGCPKNMVDGEVMASLAAERGWTLCQEAAEAEVIVVNTCGFIERAKEESIAAILEQARYKEAGSCRALIVSGCLGQRYADELLAELPEVDAVCGTAAFCDLPWVLEQALAGHRFKHLRPLAVPAFKRLPRLLSTPGHYAYLKIAEGCDNCCSYCVIPAIRGPYRSRPLDEVVEEAEALAGAGVKELILVAQDTSQYGLDLAGRLLLPELLRRLNAIPGLRWLRLLYLYPENITPELIQALADCSKVCHYVDLPLQHASDKVLREMNRREERRQLEALLAKLRQALPDVALRTTFIVGFPGETEEDFAQLLAFVQEQKFTNAGVFTYSREEGTEAGERPDQVPAVVKEERYHRLMAVQAAISEAQERALEGRVLEVVIEEELEPEGDGYHRYAARSYREAPEIDGNIYVESRQSLALGSFLPVRVQQGFAYEAVAQPLAEEEGL